MFVAIVASALAARTRSQTEAARREARTTAELYAFSRKIAGVMELYDLLWTVVTHLARLLNAEVVILHARATATGSRVAPPFRPTASSATPTWPRRAGRGMPTIRPARAPTPCPAAAGCSCRSAPAAAPVGVIGVLPLRTGASSAPPSAGCSTRWATRPPSPSSACTLAADIDQARLGDERERLRSAMLTSVSARPAHAARLDHRRAVAASGAIATATTQPTRDELLATALSEAERLDRFVGNLLDMTRLDAGAIVPNARAGRCRRPRFDGAAPRGAAAAGPRGRRPRSRRTCRRCRSISCWPSRCCSTCSTMPPSIRPAGGRIEIEARRGRRARRDRRARRGPGHLRRGAGPHLRQVLSRRCGDRRRAGTGLGLAIAKGFVEAQGGTHRGAATATDRQRRARSIRLRCQLGRRG